MVERGTLKMHVMKLKNLTRDFRESITSDTSYEEDTSLKNLESLRDELSYHADAIGDILSDIEANIKELEDEIPEEDIEEEPDGDIEEEPSIFEQHYGNETKEEENTDGRTASPDRQFDVE